MRTMIATLMLLAVLFTACGGYQSPGSGGGGSTAAPAPTY
jgi:hypothetical protein